MGILNQCTPIEMHKIIAESDQAFAKILEVSNTVPLSSGGGYMYIHRPKVLRGQQREEAGQSKEAFDLQIEKELIQHQKDLEYQ